MFGAAPETRDPIELVNWKAVFEFPWIAPERERAFSVPYAATVEVATTLYRALPVEDQRRFCERLGLEKR